MRTLQQWLQQKEWSLAEWEQMDGGYAADLYKITLRDAAGHLIPAIYKKLAPARESEIHLYNDILSAVPVAVPKLIGVLRETDGQGLVIEYGGEVLKPVYQNSSDADKRRILSKLVQLLAKLHSSTELKAIDWLRTGAVSTYPYTSAVEWGQLALQELALLQQERIGGLTEQTITELRQSVEVFYPRYAELTDERTTLTHGDPHMENILFEQGKFQLIDWEWSCVSVPQRDLSILLQDVLDDQMHEYAWKQYRAEMDKQGWDSESSQFEQTFFACMVDNTLMMLGWEVKKFRAGHVSREEIEKIITVKVHWIRQYYQRLSM